MRRVLFTNHLPLGSGSGYRQTDLAKCLAKKGFVCDFLGRRPRQIPAQAGDSAPPDYGPFSSVAYWEEPLERKLFANVRLFRRRAEGATLVHVNRANPYTATVVSLGNLRRKKLTVDMEDWDGFGGYSSYAGFYGLKGDLLTVYERVFPRQGDLVLAVSHLLMKRMQQLGVPRDKLLFLPNGYDEECFNPAVRGDEVREEFSLEKSKVVIYISAFHQFEAELHKIALDAFKLVSREVPSAKLLMVGGGNLDVASLIAASGLQDRVVHAGRVPREKIAPMIAAADLAMHVISDHPFHAASSPMVMPEYMAMAKALVAPNIGELAFGLAGGAGLLVDRPDPRLLAEGIVRLLRDDSARESIGKHAVEKARAEYSYDVLSARLRSAYARLSW